MIGTKYYAKDKFNRTIEWGQVLDIKETEDNKVVVVHFPKNPPGEKVILIPFEHIDALITYGKIWRRKGGRL